MDAVEATVNASLGVVVSIAAVQLLWPLFGWAATSAQSVAVTALFWALSTIRSYAVRKAFRWLS